MNQNGLRKKLTKKMKLNISIKAVIGKLEKKVILEKF